MRSTQETQPLHTKEQTIRREEEPFPKDPQESLGRILNAVNIGPKAATLLLLREYPPPNSYIRIEDLRADFKDLMRGTKGFGITACANKYARKASPCEANLAPHLPI